MRQIDGRYGGVALTGTLYEPGDDPPDYEGAPTPETPFVWVCDAIRPVESGGVVQSIDGRDVRVTFERPAPRGFEDRGVAIDAAFDHLRDQFARLDVDTDAVTVTVDP
ncbi:MAG: hypothetical protein ABEJ86_01680 [Halococcoides sp.]